MKMKFTIAAAILLAAPLCAIAQKSPVVGEVPTGPQIEMKMKQIELDVAMKQFEKIATSLAGARTESQLLDRSELSEEQIKQKMNQADEKLARLTKLKDELQNEIREKVAELDQFRRRFQQAKDAETGATRKKLPLVDPSFKTPVESGTEKPVGPRKKLPEPSEQPKAPEKF